MKTESTNPPSGPAWFCLRSQPKHEHIAARRLAELPGVETFLPRIRFRRSTRTGAAWATEALFPNYLFARFDWQDSARAVRHATGVAGIVHFGLQYPTLDDAVIAELCSLFGTEQLHVIPAALEVGETVQVTGGAFHGLRAVITQVMPARQRVSVLLEFLGRPTPVEVSQTHLVRPGDARQHLA